MLCSSGSRCGNEPCSDDPLKVDIRDMVGVEFQRRCEIRQIREKRLIGPAHTRGARQVAARDIGQPVAGFFQSANRFAIMPMDVHAGEVGDETLIAILLDVEDQDALRLLVLATIALCAKKQPQFERHLEARQVMDRVEFGPRQVMNAVSAIGDQAIDLVDSRLAAIVELARVHGTSVVAEGKPAVARDREEAVPEGLVLDAEGRASTDPGDFYRGGVLLPFGGHKGYGLSVLIEIVAGLLTGTGIGSMPGYTGDFGTVLVAFAIDAFQPVDEFRARTEEFCRALDDTPPAQGHREVLVPGEPEERTRAERERDGVPIPDTTWQELRALLEE